MFSVYRWRPGGCFNKHDGLSDGSSFRSLSIVEWSDARSDGPSCLSKQPPETLINDWSVVDMIVNIRYILGSMSVNHQILSDNTKNISTHAVSSLF